MNQIDVRGLRLELRVGWSPEERARPQPIDVDFLLSFPDELPACQTDRLQDTVCYATLCSRICEHCRQHEFRLLEHLAAQIGKLLERELQAADKPASIEVRVHKPQAPVPGLTGGVSFRWSRA